LLPIVAGLAVIAATSKPRQARISGPPGLDSMFAALARDMTHDIKRRPRHPR
jgi:hypothetical protein